MLQHGSIALRLYFKLATARDELSVSRKVTETSLCRSSKAWKVNAMRPSETGQTKLSDEEWRNLILVGPKGRGGSRYYSAICPICLITYDVDTSSARTLAVEKVASHIKNAHSDALT
jgi:hypothetical protein